MTTLFVFIDESGNFDFSPKGPRHFVMSAVATNNPVDVSNSMHRLKYQLLAEGQNIPHFHASEDLQSVRNRVFDLIRSMTGIAGHTLWVDKRQAAPPLQSSSNIYALFGGAISKYILKSVAPDQYKKVVLVFDKALKSSDEKAFLKKVKPGLSATGTPYSVFFQSVKADSTGQVADYVAWAHYVQLEKGERRPMEALPDELKSQFNLFRFGHTLYY